jgi:hypothetical protein
MVGESATADCRKEAEEAGNCDGGAWNLLLGVVAF